MQLETCVVIKNSFIEQLQCVMHFSRPFPDVVSFYFHNDSMKNSGLEMLNNLTTVMCLVKGRALILVHDFQRLKLILYFCLMLPLCQEGKKLYL